MAKMDLPGTTRRINAVMQRIKNQYLFDDGNLPWLIGYSGGKDSTCTAQLVFKTLLEMRSEGIELNRRVIVFSSDTMIENPLVKKIVSKNIALINQQATSVGIPVEAVILRPDLSKTFWVNIVGRGYPCPNTMFRWCTDRLKIEPANTFVKQFIDKNGETIMVLGVRQGESQTRDRVLKQHGVEGEHLMRHTTLTNAYVFPPIIDLSTIDVFTYLSEFQSPWGSSNKELFFFYEESGGGECPIFLSEKDKTTKNSCGNSRLGCWVCTVVSQDKSLSGFIETGYHDYLKPLLNFRNWLAEIRDNDDYRLRFRANGSMYLVNLQTKKDPLTGTVSIIIPKKGSRPQIELPLRSEDTFLKQSTEYVLVPDGSISEYMQRNGLTPKSPEMAKVIIWNHVTGLYSRLGAGPFTHEARVEILRRLLETEQQYGSAIKNPTQLILDSELIEITKIWAKTGYNTEIINDLLREFGRKPIVIEKDEFETITEKYSSDLRSLVKANKLDHDVISKILQIEKDYACDDERSQAQHDLMHLFNSDRFNY